MRLHPAVPVLAACVVLGLHVADWWFYVADDAFISLRYVERWLAGDGLTWTDGPPVEGYSNFLWVLLTAVVGATGLDLLLAGRIVAVACGVGTIAALAWPLARAQPAGGWVAGLAVALSTSTVLWIPGGLEQPLVALLMALTLAGLGHGLSQPTVTVRTVLGPAIALALLCWTRPDSPVLVAGVCLGWFLAAGQDKAALRSAAALAAIPAGATLLQVAGRLAYYGDWVPNTAHVKVRPSEAHTDMGALWTAQALDNHLPLVALAALAFVGWPAGEAPRSRVRLALPVLGVWLSWTVWIGGDIFPAFRHFVPMVVVFAWLAGSGVVGLSARHRAVGPVLAVVATALLGWMTVEQRGHHVVARAHNERWVIDALDVGTLLREAFWEEQPLIALSPAGALPYASRLPCLDMIGLNDRHIGRTETAGAGWLGHETGDGDYVFQQRPDIVFFQGPRGGDRATFTSELQLAARPDFTATYAMVRWQTRAVHADAPVVTEPWVRRSGRLGPVESGDQVTVPAWLLTELGGTATPDDTGRLRLRLAAGEAAGASVVLPGGTWMVEAPPGVEVSVEPDGRRTRLGLTATSDVELASLVLRRASPHTEGATGSPGDPP